MQAIAFIASFSRDGSVRDSCWPAAAAAALQPCCNHNCDLSRHIQRRESAVFGEQVAAQRGKSVVSSNIRFSNPGSELSRASPARLLAHSSLFNQQQQQ